MKSSFMSGGELTHCRPMMQHQPSGQPVACTLPSVISAYQSTSLQNTRTPFEHWTMVDYPFNDIDHCLFDNEYSVFSDAYVGLPFESRNDVSDLRRRTTVTIDDVTSQSSTSSNSADSTASLVMSDLFKELLYRLELQSDSDDSTTTAASAFDSATWCPIMVSSSDPFTSQVENCDAKLMSQSHSSNVVFATSDEDSVGYREIKHGMSDTESEDNSKYQIKRKVHLWQFLKELLENPSAYHYAIHWVDENQGIFKIQSSSAVAKLWGQRTGHPSMNYDKLSRSLRQYYKKGIMRKTISSKRLVYQFCPQYI